MTERSRNKLAQLTDDLVNTPISESERRRRGLILPELRLRSDSPAIEIDEATPVVQALTRLEAERDGALALREASGEPTAVLLSVERYLALASKEINSAPRVEAMPVRAAFDKAHVDQVDPNDYWGSPPALPGQIA